MKILLVDPATNLIVNVAVAPEGSNSNVWFAPDGLNAVQSETGDIGDSWIDGTLHPLDRSVPIPPPHHDPE